MTLDKYLIPPSTKVFVLSPSVPQAEEAAAWKILWFLAVLEFIWHFSVRSGMLGKVDFGANLVATPSS